MFLSVRIGQNQTMESSLREDFRSHRIKKLHKQTIPRQLDEREVKFIVNLVKTFSALLALEYFFESFDVLRRRSLGSPTRGLSFEQTSDLQ